MLSAKIGERRKQVTARYITVISLSHNIRIERRCLLTDTKRFDLKLDTKPLQKAST
mgnify:CR=1 FL=1